MRSTTVAASTTPKDDGDDDAMAGGAETPHIAASPAIARLAAQIRLMQRLAVIHAIPDACYVTAFGRKTALPLSGVL